LVAPGLCAAGLGACLVAMIAKRDLLTGGIDTPFIHNLHWLMLTVAFAGVGTALWCRHRHPTIYAGLGRAA